MLKLQFKDSRQAPVWLADERITIGQDHRNSLVLPDFGVSLFHAEICRDDGHYYLSDCASEAGTLINGERISSRYQIRADDLLQVGAVELHFIDPMKPQAKLDNSKKWFLQVLQGENQGNKYPLAGSMTFGRSVKCELCFNDPELSRRHCEFFLKDGVLEVKDLGSANGLQVNRQKVTTATLLAGDQMQMGGVTLLVIGPKVDEVQQAAQEDVTLFMPMVALPKVNKVATASVATAKASAAADQVSPRPAGNSKLLYAGLVVLVLAVAAWALTRFL